MRHMLIAAFLLFAIPPATSVAATLVPKSEFSLGLKGDIEIGPDGTVQSYALDEGLEPPVHKLVSASIERWKFEPILVDGRAVIAKTRMSMELKAVPATDGYALKVDRVWFGEPLRTSLSPPSYPAEAANAGVGARVVLVLRIDGMGNVIEAHPEQTSLTAKPRRMLADRWRRLFESASLASAAQWKFEMPEIIDGVRAESSSVRVPVVFMMGKETDMAQWHGVIPGPVVPAPWVGQKQAPASVAHDLGDGEMQALDSRFKLQTQVVGMLL